MLQRPFVLMCLSSFLFFSSFNMLIPELPDYLSNMGGAEYKGWIIGIFTITAGLSRPFSGKLTDSWGRIPVMLFGAAVCVVAGLMYPLVTTPLAFLTLRLFHGFSTGFKPTGTAAYVADIVPADRRGEAMGIYGFSTSLGMAAGPFLGGVIGQYWDLNVLFFTSSIFAFLSVAILYQMEETLSPAKKEKFSFGLLKVRWSEIIDKDVWPVTVVVFLTTFSYGTVITLAPDLTKETSFQNKGFYFLLFTLASLATRVVGGKISDRKGRVPTLIVGCFFLVAALGFTAKVGNEIFFVLGGIFFGFSWGLIGPSYQAWTVDLSKLANRGRAIATMYIALELGIGSGSVLPMLVYQNDVNKLHLAFLWAAAMALLAIPFLLVYRNLKFSPK